MAAASSADTRRKALPEAGADHCYSGRCHDGAREPAHGVGKRRSRRTPRPRVRRGGAEIRDLATTDPDIATADRRALEDTRGLRRLIKRLALFALGRPIRCAECGRELFVGLPIVHRGEVRLIGLPHGLVIRVAFSSTNRLEFRHVELDSCPTPDRPWAG